MLLYIKHGLFDLAADVLAEYVHLHQTCLSQDLYDFLEAAIVTRSQPEVAYHKVRTQPMRALFVLFRC